MDCTKRHLDEEINGKSDKKQKVEENDLPFQNLKNFEIVRVLNNLDEKCSIAIEGKFKGKEGKAVIQLQKLPFNQEKLSEMFECDGSLRKLFVNDIYHNLMFSIPENLNELKALVIYPAEEKHLKKYEKHSSCFIHETPELYKSVTLPYIKSSSYSKQWIYNILERKQEAERIVCEDLDPELGFVLVPDMKWSGEQMENLYLQALVMSRSIGCIRDLTAQHIPLLNNIYDKCTKEIEEKYGVPSHKLRIYFHYQPSYYHLHIHFSALSFEAPGTRVGQSILVKDVINNLSIDSEYYQKASLSYCISDSHPLLKKFKEHGYFDSK